jgi:hypothetical protein
MLVGRGPGHGSASVTDNLVGALRGLGSSPTPSALDCYSLLTLWLVVAIMMLIISRVGQNPPQNPGTISHRVLDQPIDAI